MSNDQYGIQRFQQPINLNTVNSYQISGIPFAKGPILVPGSNEDPLEIIFPSITQRIHIENFDLVADHTLRIGFSAAGVKGENHWLLDSHAASGKGRDYIELRIKVDRIFLLGGKVKEPTNKIYIAAELTGITLNYNLSDVYSSSTTGV